MNIPCCLCNSETANTKFHLQETLSATSKISLWLLLKKFIAEDLFITNYIICTQCYILLNELDNIKVRLGIIEDTLKSYVQKCHTNVTDCSKKQDTQEGYSLCLKTVDTNKLKSHLKGDYSDLSAFKSNFDVQSISEINPSLEGTNLTNVAENIGKTHEKSENIEACANIIRKRIDLKQYSCSVCQKNWKSVSELKNHMYSHSNDKPFICEICGQAYKRKQALLVHVGMHKGINPYTCVYCKKSFTQKGALARHTPIHTGELPFQCDLCGKRFLHHSSFNIHKLSHTGEKSYKCEVCGLLLISASHLKRHMRGHTGEKKFTCGVCGKKFAEKYNLAVHEKLHLGISKRKKYQ